MLQSKVDPADPEYNFHSGDIVSLLKDLFGDSKKEMGSNSDAMKSLEKNIQKLAKEIANHRGNLVEANSDLKDDEVYLKDLTAQCEARANDYDQRSSMRNSELTALTQALSILKGSVKGAADDVNQR